MENFEKVLEPKEEYPDIRVMLHILNEKFKENKEMSIELVKAYKEAKNGNAEKLEKLFDKHCRNLSKEELRRMGRPYDQTGLQKEGEESPSQIIDTRV